MLPSCLKRSCLLTLLLAALLASCTYTTTDYNYRPAFTTGKAAVTAAISRIVTGEQINLTGKKITTNGMETTVLDIQILNGQNIPESLDAKKVMAKEIATTVKKNLKDPGQYETYKVNFEKLTKTGDGAQSTTVGITLEKDDL